MVRTSLATVAALLVACSSTIDNGFPEEKGSSGSSGSSGASGTSGSSGDYVDPSGTGATRPPPTIASTGPLEGEYGTLVTITGDNLDEASAKLELGTPTENLSFPKPAAGTGDGLPTAVIKKWTKTEIQFKYPFPAEGVIRVVTKSGQAEGASFVPAWRPGSPLAVKLTRRELLGAVSPANGTIVAMFDGASGPKILMGNPDGSVTAKSYNRGSGELLTGSLYVTPAGKVDGFFVNNGTLWQLTDAAGTPSTSSTSVSAVRAAGGIDATGAYAWVKTSGGTINRYRAPSWAATGEAVADPTPASAPGPSMAVGNDNSLYVGWGVNSTGSFPTYDHTTSAVTQRLRAGMTTFDAKRTVGGGADDYMLWTRFYGGPEGRVSSYFCASDTGAFSSATLDCEEGYAGNGTTKPSGTIVSEYVVGYGASSAVAVSCDRATATLKMGPETQSAQQVPALFPCPGIVTAAADPTGAAVVLVQAGAYVYAPKKR